MKIRQVTKEYSIDLSLPEEERWGEVILKERTAARAVIRRATRDFLGYDATSEKAPVWKDRAIRMFSSAYRFSGGHYGGELEAWAAAIGCSAAELTLLNCQYELSQFSERAGALLEGPAGWLQNLLRLGCTSGAVRVAPGRVFHVRTMDWPLREIAKSTRIFRFFEGDREFISIGVPGMVGALSGMVPGAYSATIDYAPPTFTPGFDIGPLFMLRRVFETCDSYEDACHALSHTRLSSNVMFMVCSAKGQACVIERTRNDYAKRPMRDGILTVANHFKSGKFSHHNDGWHPEIIEDSCARTECLATGLRQAGPRCSLEKAAGFLDHAPVLNDETRQMMAFDPRKGEVLAWAVE